MLYGPTFCLIYRHTLALISALFNADLSCPRTESLRLTLYLLLPATRASYLSLALSLYGNKVFPDFRLQIRVSRRPAISLICRSQCTVIICISPLSLPLPSRLTVFSPLFLPKVILIKRYVPSSRFNSFRSRWHEKEEEEFCL